jgi:hypothetical protein
MKVEEPLVILNILLPLASTDADTLPLKIKLEAAAPPVFKANEAVIAYDEEIALKPNEEVNAFDALTAYDDEEAFLTNDAVMA